MKHDIPSMGGSEIGAFFYDLASDLQGLGAVIECGSWLGASIAPVATALAEQESDIEIHCYDRWQATRGQVRKAKKAGVDIEEGQDLLPLFLDNVGNIYDHIIPHKGDFSNVSWSGDDIELYIDDLNKDPQLFQHAMRTFGPRFIPNETVIVLMDFNYFQTLNSSINRKLKRCQKDFIEANHNSFCQITEFEDIPCAAFKYTEPLDWTDPILQTNLQQLYTKYDTFRAICWKAINHNI